MRLQFGVRTLLVGTALAGAILGVEVHRARRVEVAMRQVHSMQGRVRFIPRFGDPADRLNYQYLGPQSQLTAFQRVSLGFRNRISGVELRGTGNGESDLALVASLAPLEGLLFPNAALNADGLKYVGRLSTLLALDLRSATLESSGLRQLANLKELVQLDLSGSNITDEGLAFIAGLSRLKGVKLGNTAISDAGVKLLGRGECLEHLELNGTDVGDASIAVIASFPALKYVRLKKTRVTPVAIAKLRKSKPELGIEY